MAAVQCTGQQLETITSIEFTKQTRGYLDKIKISKDSVQGMVRQSSRGDAIKKQMAGTAAAPTWNR